LASRVLVAVRIRTTPERAFEAFTQEIGVWWRPNGLFQFHPRGTGTLAFEPGEGGRLTETLVDGRIFEVGRIRVWEPPSRLTFSWRQASFREGQETEVQVRFEDLGGETRVTVEHLGWDSVPQENVARHRFPNDVFLQRHAEWWQRLLRSLANTAAEPGQT
jgi:uncharacterized protein YndB with AHSA1/START domain